MSVRPSVCVRLTRDLGQMTANASQMCLLGGTWQSRHKRALGAAPKWTEKYFYSHRLNFYQCFYQHTFQWLCPRFPCNSSLWIHAVQSAAWYLHWVVAWQQNADTYTFEHTSAAQPVPLHDGGGNPHYECSWRMWVTRTINILSAFLYNSDELFGLSVRLSHPWRGPLRHVCATPTVSPHTGPTHYGRWGFPGWLNKTWTELESPTDRRCVFLASCLLFWPKSSSTNNFRDLGHCGNEWHVSLFNR